MIPSGLGKDQVTIFRETLEAQERDAKKHFDVLQADYNALDQQYRAVQLALNQERRKTKQLAERQRVIARWVRDLRDIMTWEFPS